MSGNIINESPYSNGYVIRYPDGDESLEREVNTSYTDYVVHTVLDGETIQSIAFKYYGDSGLWGVIADVNDILNPFEELYGGLELIIPNYVG